MYHRVRNPQLSIYQENDLEIMHPIFDITASEIQTLNDANARELVARLCKAELQAKDESTSAVTWGGDQRAKDGGVDVRVEISPAIGISGYIPKDSTAFQVKAESFTPSKISGEMAPDRILRPAIVELNDNSGAYVIVSTKDSCSDSSLKNRKLAMTDCLTQFGFAEGVSIDFYDSQKIADWVSNYPSVQIWLRSILGKTIDGWRPYGPWAYRETSMEDEYLLDGKVKIFTPISDRGVAITDAINELRSNLLNPQVSVRLVGLSGVGKTRLVQALFDHRIETTVAALDQENVLYTDLSDRPNPQPTAMIEALILDGASSIVVIDNCGQEVHRRLTDLVQQSASKIRLITVEYDIRDDVPDHTKCYRLESSSDEIITKLLGRQFESLTHLDINKIVSFSDGNARVALALASTSQVKGELARLADEALFLRLFEQKHIPDAELLRCAEAASLLYSFDVEDIADQSELATLAALAEVSIPTFFRNVEELEKRGLVQKRGKWRAVLPHAIANRLALHGVQSNHQTLLVKRLVSDATERVARSFSRRLGYLHESTRAQQVAEEWLKPYGLLGDATQLSDSRIQMLVNIAPVNQPSVLRVILRAIGQQDFVSLSNPNRRSFSHLLRSLAYEQELFEDAANALLQFALNEPEGVRNGDARDTLKSLFYSHLSGTHASPEQRASFIRTLALSEDEQKQEMALLLLRPTLEVHYFSGHYGYDFGALKRDYGWYPRTGSEIQHWYGLFIAVAENLGKQRTVLGSDSRCLLGQSFRGLWCAAQMRGALINAAEEFAEIDGWPDGWIGARNTLYFDKAGLSSESLSDLEKLEQSLAPRNLMAKIQAKILSRGSHGASLLDEELEQGSRVSGYEKARDEAKVLGRLAASEQHVLDDLSPFLSHTRSTDKSFSFAFGIGETAVSVSGILDQVKLTQEVKRVNDLNTIFIRGLVAGWYSKHPNEVARFLDTALIDDFWVTMIPELQLAVGIDSQTHWRLITCLENNKTPLWQFNYLTGLISDFTLPQLSSLINALKVKPDQGLETAIHLLSIATFGIRDKDSVYQSELKTYCQTFIAMLDWNIFDFGHNNLIHDVSTIIDYSLLDSTFNEVVASSLQNIIDFGRSENSRFLHEMGDFLAPYFKYHSLEALDACYFDANEETYPTPANIVSIRYSGESITAVAQVTEDTLISWCRFSPEDRCKFAAQTCKLMEHSETFASESVANSISKSAKSIFALTPDKKCILRIYVSRLEPTSYSGSRAAIMRKNLHFLDQFNPHKDPDIQTQIDDAKVYFSKSIDLEEKWELEREASQTGSFE